MAPLLPRTTLRNEHYDPFTDEGTPTRGDEGTSRQYWSQSGQRQDLSRDHQCPCFEPPVACRVAAAAWAWLFCLLPPPVTLNVPEAQILYAIPGSVCLSPGLQLACISLGLCPLPSAPPAPSPAPNSEDTAFRAAQRPRNSFGYTCCSVASPRVTQGKAESLCLLGPHSATLYLSHVGAARARDLRRGRGAPGKQPRRGPWGLPQW